MNRNQAPATELQQIPGTPERLRAGEPVRIAPTEFLVDSDQLADQFGLGFDGRLRTVIECAPDSPDDTERFYIFERSQQQLEGYAAIPGDKTNIPLAPEERYIVMTQRAVDEALEAHVNGYSVKSRTGWGKFASDSSLIIGRNDGAHEALRAHSLSTGTDANLSISRNHFELQLGKDGTITVTDLKSSNGTEVRRSTGNGGELVGAAMSGEKAHYLGQGLTSAVVEVERRKVGLEVGQAEQPLKGEDTILNKPESGLFGVFDGAGGDANARFASQSAAQQVELSFTTEYEKLKKHGKASPNQIEAVLRNSLNEANKVVRERAPGGATTGTVVVTQEEGGKNYAIWASVGDSRLYTFNRKSGTLRQVSEDESHPEHAHMILNALGADRKLRLRQSGIIALEEGDELMLCSDGLTGDYEPDILSKEEIATVMRAGQNAQDTANRLLAIARKRDDRSVLVIA